MAGLYDTLLWRTAAARAKRRDANRCTVARLLGGSCRGSLHAHHIVRPEDGGAMFDLENLGTVCAAHHPKWEALRRRLSGDRVEAPVRCPHRHRSAEARAICERRMARERGLQTA